MYYVYDSFALWKFGLYRISNCSKLLVSSSALLVLQQPYGLLFYLNQKHSCEIYLILVYFMINFWFDAFRTRA